MKVHVSRRSLAEREVCPVYCEVARGAADAIPQIRQSSQVRDRTCKREGVKRNVKARLTRRTDGGNVREEERAPLLR